MLLRAKLFKVFFLKTVVMMATISPNQSERSKNCLDQSESRI